MNLAFDVDSSIARDKQAALFLQTLNENDREWLLSRLPENIREKAKALITEVSEIGIDAGSLEHFHGSIKERLMAQPKKALPGEVFTELDLQADKDVFLHLEKEPIEVVAVVLNAYQWTWREDVLKRFKPRMRNAIRDAINNTGHDTGQGKIAGFKQQILAELLARIKNNEMRKSTTVV